MRPRPYDGRLIVGVVFLSGALTVGSSAYAFGLFIQPLEEQFDWPRTAISASLSFMAIGSLAGPLIGRLMDRHGARPVLVACLTLYGLGLVLRPWMTELWHFYAFSAVQFVGFSGAAFLPAGRLVAIWFPRSRGRVMGITMMGNNFGGLTAPLAVGFLLAVSSWEAAYIALAAASFSLGLAALVLVHEDTGRGSAAQAQGGPTLTGATLSEALHTSSFYTITLALTLAAYTYSTILPHISAFLTDEGLERGAMLAAVALLATFGMMGKLFFGYLAERITARRAMMASLGGQLVFILALVANPTLPLVWFSAPLYGFSMGGHGVLATLLVQDAFGVKFYGSISGLVNALAVVPLVTGPLLAGASSDLTESYAHAFLIVGAMIIIAIATLTQVRPASFPP